MDDPDLDICRHCKTIRAGHKIDPVLNPGFIHEFDPIPGVSLAPPPTNESTVTA